MIRTDAPPKAIDAFSKVPSFSGLDQATLEAVARSAIPRAYQEKQVVFLEGEPCAGLYVIQEGWLKSIKISAAGREQVIRFVGPGETFNEISVFAGGTNQVTVEALEAARVWIIPRQALFQLIEEHPVLCQTVIQNLAKRTLHLISLIEDLSLRPVEARLARLLLEQSNRGVVNRRRWSTQAELASRLGTVPDVLNRAFRNLVEAGLIDLERQQIQILDREGLEAKAMLGN
jgi:CRP/FNR family transcriptional regulator